MYKSNLFCLQEVCWNCEFHLIFLTEALKYISNQPLVMKSLTKNSKSAFKYVTVGFGPMAPTQVKKISIIFTARQTFYYTIRHLAHGLLPFTQCAHFAHICFPHLHMEDCSLHLDYLIFGETALGFWDR